jgi:hypothetical protein
VCYRSAAKRALWLFIAPFCDTVPTWINIKQKLKDRQTSEEHKKKGVRNKNAGRQYQQNTWPQEVAVGC